MTIPREFDDDDVSSSSFDDGDLLAPLRSHRRASDRPSGSNRSSSGSGDDRRRRASEGDRIRRHDRTAREQRHDGGGVRRRSKEKRASSSSSSSHARAKDSASSIASSANSSRESSRQDGRSSRGGVGGGGGRDDRRDREGSSSRRRRRRHRHRDDDAGSSSSRSKTYRTTSCVSGTAASFSVSTANVDVDSGGGTTNAAPSSTASISLDDLDDDFAPSVRSARLDEAARLAEVEKYAVLARRKASLMTDHDFERRTGGTGGDGDGDVGDDDRGSERRGGHGKSGRSEQRGDGGSSAKGRDDGDDGRRRKRRSGESSRTSSSSSSSRQRSKNESASRRKSRKGRKRDPDARSSRTKSIPEEEEGKEGGKGEEIQDVATVPGNLRQSPVGPSPPPLRDDDDKDDVDAIAHVMTGASVGGDGCDASTVSSMSTTDSYVRKQLYFYELRRRAERDERVRRREARERRAQLLEEEDKREERKREVERKAREEGYFDDGHGLDGENVCIEEGDEGEEQEEEEDCYFPHFPEEEDEEDEEEDKEDEEDDEENYNEARTCGQSTHAGRSSRAPTTSAASNLSPPVYQREECCIKHPGVLLRDRTEVDVWTCMRHCKDPASGRWNTVKMVCEACLAEDEEMHEYDTPFHRRMRRDLRGFRPAQIDNNGAFVDASQEPSVSSPPKDVEDPEDGGTCSTSSLFTDAPTTPGASSSSSSLERQKNNLLPVEGVGNQTPLEREAEAQRRRFVRRLAARAYHFPGNTWREDWTQYISNTHLVFGIFLHHPLHPVNGRERCVILLGSVAVGLLLSNLIYLWFVHKGYGADDVLLSLGPHGGIEVTKLMITLWTLGSFAHTCFDLSVWHIKACTPCRYSDGGRLRVGDRCAGCGGAAGATIVLMTLAFATYLVLLRASEGYEVVVDDDGDGVHDHSGGGVVGTSFIRPVALGFGGTRDFAFLSGYVVEFVLAVFVYNPLMLTIVFSGALGCNGKVPVVGGRPRELRQQQRYAAKRQRYTMPQVLKLGDREYEADMWGSSDHRLATNF